MTSVAVNKLLCCLVEGNTAYAKFINDRLRKKSLSIHSTIDKIKFVSPITTVKIKFVSPKTNLTLNFEANIIQETIKTLVFIEYGCHWGFTVEELLQRVITNSAFFLVDKDSHLRKRVK